MNRTDRITVPKILKTLYFFGNKKSSRKGRGERRGGRRPPQRENPVPLTPPETPNAVKLTIA
jgi:hypothetical protein